MSGTNKCEAIVFTGNGEAFKAVRRRLFWRDVRQAAAVMLFGLIVLGLVFAYWVLLGGEPVALGRGL